MIIDKRSQSYVGIDKYTDRISLLDLNLKLIIYSYVDFSKINGFYITGPMRMHNCIREYLKINGSLKYTQLWNHQQQCKKTWIANFLLFVFKQII